MKKNFVYFSKIFWGKAKQMSTVMLSGYMCTCGSLVYKWISIVADVGGTHCKSSLASIVSSQFPELAIYVETEIKVVEHELLSLHKVMVKLELQMKEAMDTEG